MKKSKNFLIKNNLTLFFTLLFVYVVLFEFILPINKILPKPSLLYESLPHIWQDYNLIWTITTTTSVIYITLAACIVILYIGAAKYFKIFIEMEYLILAFSFLRFIPFFFLIVLFNFWFPQSLLGEFIFSLLATLYLALQKLFKESKNVKEEYILVARNLNLAHCDIYKQVYWKSSLPSFSKYYRQVHFNLWTIVLIYEFIGNSHGFGFIYRSALAYNDFTALFTITILISLLICLGDYLIRLYSKKIIYWTA